MIALGLGVFSMAAVLALVGVIRGIADPGFLVMTAAMGGQMDEIAERATVLIENTNDS